jgi:cell wall-associated NlpC family hydrolase
MNTSHARPIVGAVLLASAVLVLCSARAPLADRSPFPGPHTRELRAVRVFQKHRLALRDSIVRLALAQVGTRYDFGGMTPQRGFDCSGLVRYVFSQLALTPPRTAAKQARIGAAIQRDRLRPGDLLTFGIGDSVTHIGIYVGDRKFVHASSIAGRVIVSAVDRPPSDLIRPLKGARRLLAIADPLDYPLRGD